MPKVILEGTIEIPKEDLNAVITELDTHKKLTQKEDGCLVFVVEQDQTVENLFTVYEEFDCKDAFELHQKRVKSSKWGELTKNSTRNYKIKYV